MAEYNLAFERTMGNEGGYSNDPDDRGGETCKGISRIHNPKWSGWPIIDRLKAEGVTGDKICSHSLLKTHVQLFYKPMYWDIFQGDAINDQTIANQMFDMSVLFGPNRAAKFVQRACNITSPTYPIAVDGICGQGTVQRINQITSARNVLNGMLIATRVNHHMDVVERDPTQRKYLDGWVARAFGGLV